ncbi:polymorphic toxin type 27 domain-containing protein [Nonomuraea jiangxiensis]|uniref:Intein C-terminal splicing region n=1 Tax=Nonomuraea jiangxiensis TaxID=633440 RepID=A0A1G8P4U6_9ACTN|nr:polymorphic toxin type 27 domain-containing protein [Nonomuraea jiangxiensis]SDI87452.1 intein C-terminal splicing region [Nonomuraea jiangxiensis]
MPTNIPLLGRLRAIAAALTCAAVVVGGAQIVPLPGIRPAAAFADTGAGEGEYDLAHAAEVRAAQCLLTVVQRKGGQDLKAVARAGLVGTDTDLLRAANPEYWTEPPTPLSAAYDKDGERASAKGDELDGRRAVWEQPLSVTPPDGYTHAGFQTIGRTDSPFTKVGLIGWINNQYWQGESDFYDDQTPVASRQSVDAVNAIAAERYTMEKDYEGWRAWEDMTFMHPMYADDARAFLATGGFPTSAPAPDSMEFRVDVENLKARYASCTTQNPPDPYKVLEAEFATASAEWQQEVDGQRVQRDTILKEEAQATADLQVATQALGEALGQSIIAVRLADWQAFWLKQTSANPSYPDAAEFTQVKNDIVKAQAMALGRVFVASRAAQSAQEHAASAVAAQQAAYAIADAAGLPRGRGLLYGQQAVQVTRASAAAAKAVAKATETASNATRASAADSKTLMALAETQAHATQAEFRRIAAEEAAAQAKAAADGAAAQAAEAALNATKAKQAQSRAEAAEQEAEAAAADARSRRATAEAERDRAEAQKEIAAGERAKARTAEATAQNQRQVAAAALSDAEAAGGTAAERKTAALEAERKARDARNKAVEAEAERDALTAKAAAREAHAAAVEGTDAAQDARAAATQARAAADRATAAAASARAAATEATEAATAAREAATRAEAAASRARAASDAAQRDVAITNAAVKKAHAAAADAIAASEAAAENVRLAKILADTAKAKAVTAKANAVVARREADAAHVDAVRTAGFAYSTAQAAVAARDSAAQVIKPANDAIELGSPYKDTDASAGLAVLTGQSSKTLAAQQAAVAQAKAAQAQRAATEAAALAAQATADAKAAAVAAAQAADSAAKAAASLAKARDSAAEAKTAAKAAVQAEADTVEYDRQATADAAAAASAADAAAGHASAARASADAAEQDAASARDAATAAENDAATARDVATQAETDASTAEAAAARARELAEQAQAAAERAEAAAEQEREAARASESGPTGIPNLISLPSEDALYDINPLEDFCTGTNGCDIDLEYHLYGTQDYYLETCSQPGRSIADCTGPLVLDYLGSGPLDVRYTKRTHFNGKDLVVNFLQGLGRALVHDYVSCWRKVTGQDGGSTTSCAWAIGSIVIPPVIKAGYTYALSLRTAMQSGTAFTQALFRLRYSGLPAEAISGLERAAGNALATGHCFPAGTLVDTEDGPRKIEDIRVGDRVWAADPATGRRTLRDVVRLFHRSVDSLVRITADSGTLSVTEGHRFWVQGKGWTQSQDLRPGDALQDPSGKADRVQAVSASDGRVDVYNFEVETDHTYYVYAGSTPVLVHNDCIKDIVKAGDHAVLGINPWSDNLARGLGGYTFNRQAFAVATPNGDGRPLWMTAATEAANNSSVRLSVTLDGVPGATTADEALASLLARGDKVPPGDWRTVADPKNGLGTAWEMTELRRAYRMERRTWESIEFYMLKDGTPTRVFPRPPLPPGS